MAGEMERRHRNLYHGIGREAFAAAVAELRERIPGLRRHEVIVGLMRLAAMVGDGHTNLSPYRDRAIGFRALPVRMYLFEDGLYVTAAAPGQAALAGWRVEAIGGVPAGEAIARVRTIIAADNAVGASVFVPVYLAMPEILHALRMSDSPDRARLTLSRDGRRRSVTLDAGPRAEAWPPDIDVALVVPPGWTDAAARRPLWLQSPRTTQVIAEIEGGEALYVRLTKTADTEARSLAQLGAEIEARARTRNPRAILLDLRLNRGGAGHLLPPLVRHLVRSEDEDTRLFVLTGRSTFSAAQFLVDDLDRYSEAILVGEPTGSKPNAFGDSLRITLPNSGITARASIYWWQENQNHAQPWTAPDVAAPLTFADYLAGCDPALEAALAWRPAPPLSERLAAAAEGGQAEVERVFAAFTAEVANRYADLPRELVRAGLQLHNDGRSEGALNVLRFGTTRFPEGADLQFVHALAAFAAGRREEARSAVTRALALDPNHREARGLKERIDAAAR